MIAVGQRAIIAEGAWSTVAGQRVPQPQWVGRNVHVLAGPDVDGDYEVTDLNGGELFVPAECLRIPLDALHPDTANDAVKAIEDAIYMHVGAGVVWLDGDQGVAVLRALLELGWTPPVVTS